MLILPTSDTSGYWTLLCETKHNKLALLSHCIIVIIHRANPYLTVARHKNESCTNWIWVERLCPVYPARHRRAEQVLSFWGNNFVNSSLSGSFSKGFLYYYLSGLEHMYFLTATLWRQTEIQVWVNCSFRMLRKADTTEILWLQNDWLYWNVLYPAFLVE